MKLCVYKWALTSFVLYVLLQAVHGRYGKLTKEKRRSSNASRKSLVSPMHTRGKILHRKGLRSHDAKLPALNGKDRLENLDAIRRLINCKVQAEHSSLESRFVICNGKKHKVTSKVRKILRELGTRRDMFPNKGNPEKYGPIYGKPITAFLDDPSLPQPSNTAPHSKYPDLGLFESGIRSTSPSGASSVLNLASNRHSMPASEPEAPGEDTPQLAPPEQPSEDVPPTVTKSEQPSEDLKKKYGVSREDDEKSDANDDSNDDEDDDNLSAEPDSESEHPEVSQEQDNENQFKAMEASKLNSGELHDIEKFLHDTNEATGGGTEGLITAPPGTLMDVSSAPGEPQYAGSGPGESRIAAINEAAREREQDRERAEVMEEESAALAEQSARDVELAKIKAHSTQREVDTLGRATMNDATSDANAMGMTGLATNDDMPSTAPFGSIWSSLRNSFYATTQSQLAEMDPTSNNRQKVHKPVSRTVMSNQAKGGHFKPQRPSSVLGRKTFSKSSGATRTSRKSMIDRKQKRNSTLLTRKSKKSEITKNDEALIPLDVVRNLLLQSKDVKTKEEGKKKSSKRNLIMPFFFQTGIKRYKINGVASPSFVPAIHGFGPSNFVQYRMQPEVWPVANSRQIFPAPFALPLPPAPMQPYNFQGDISGDSHFMGHPYAFRSNPGDAGINFPSPAELFNYGRDAPGNGNGFPMPPIGMPQMSPGMIGKGKGNFKGFVSVPIVEAISPFAMVSSPDKAIFSKSHQHSEEDEGQDPVKVADDYEAISSPQVTVPPKMYKDPSYNPRETEDFHPDGRQPAFDHPTKEQPDSYREAEEDTARAREFEMEHMKGIVGVRDENGRAIQEVGQGYKRSKEKEKRKHRKEEESPEGNTIEKKDGKIVFTKEHIGFGPITVVAKTATAALEDDDDDDNDD